MELTGISQRFYVKSIGSQSLLARSSSPALCIGKIMEKSIQEKETTLRLIDKYLDLLSKLYKECYLQKGRGALILYPFHVENIPQLSCIDYNTRNQSLDLFDNKKSRNDLAKLIDNYDPKIQGILVLITRSNATWFVTVKFKNRNKN